MIFNRNFYATRVTAQSTAAETKTFPAVYISASLGNGYVSEYIVADVTHQKLLRPLGLRLQADASCYALGNLWAEAPGLPLKQIFICDQNRVEIPIVITQ